MDFKGHQLLYYFHSEDSKCDKLREVSHVTYMSLFPFPAGISQGDLGLLLRVRVADTVRLRAF